MTKDTIHTLTGIDPWFLDHIADIVTAEGLLSRHPFDPAVLSRAKSWGFSDRRLAELWGAEEEAVASFRHTHKIFPVYKVVDTCAAEFAAYTPYSTPPTSRKTRRKRSRIPR